MTSPEISLIPSKRHEISEKKNNEQSLCDDEEEVIILAKIESLKDELKICKKRKRVRDSKSIPFGFDDSDEGHFGGPTLEPKKKRLKTDKQTDDNSPGIKKQCNHLYAFDITTGRSLRCSKCGIHKYPYIKSLS